MDSDRVLVLAGVAGSRRHGKTSRVLLVAREASAIPSTDHGAARAYVGVWYADSMVQRTDLAAHAVGRIAARWTCG